MTKSFLTTILIISAAAGLRIGVPVAAFAAPALDANKTIFGPNVYVFDATCRPRTSRTRPPRYSRRWSPTSSVPERIALLFKPGDYHVNFKVGFYTHVAGLGRDPDDVHIDGGVNVNARWMQWQRHLQLLAYAGELRRHAVGHQRHDEDRRLPGRTLAAAACHG